MYYHVLTNLNLFLTYSAQIVAIIYNFGVVLVLNQSRKYFGLFVCNSICSRNKQHWSRSHVHTHFCKDVSKFTNSGSRGSHKWTMLNYCGKKYFQKSMLNVHILIAINRDELKSNLHHLDMNPAYQSQRVLQSSFSIRILTLQSLSR